MNISIRKLVLLESNFKKIEEEAKIQGYSTNVIDAELRLRVSKLIEKIRFV